VFASIKMCLIFCSALRAGSEVRAERDYTMVWDSRLMNVASDEQTA